MLSLNSHGEKIGGICVLLVMLLKEGDCVNVRVIKSLARAILEAYCFER